LYQDAVAAFEKGYLKKPDPTFLFNLGQCYRMMHNPEQSSRQYRAYLRASPEAANRAVVEGFIKEADEEIQRKAIPAAPTGTMPRPGPPGQRARGHLGVSPRLYVQPGSLVGVKWGVGRARRALLSPRARPLARPTLRRRSGCRLRPRLI